MILKFLWLFKVKIEVEGSFLFRTCKTIEGMSVVLSVGSCTRLTLNRTWLYLPCGLIKIQFLNSFLPPISSDFHFIFISFFIFCVGKQRGMGPYRGANPFSTTVWRASICLSPVPSLISSSVLRNNWMNETPRLLPPKWSPNIICHILGVTCDFEG